MCNQRAHAYGAHRAFLNLGLRTLIYLKVMSDLQIFGHSLLYFSSDF
jgi:hypothetical protein